MATFIIRSIPGFEEWKASAKKCLTNNIHPSQTQWQVYQEGANLNLFADNEASVNRQQLGVSQGEEFQQSSTKDFKVPKAFMELAQIVICYNNPERFALLYRTLWR